MNVEKIVDGLPDVAILAGHLVDLKRVQDVSPFDADKGFAITLVSGVQVKGQPGDYDGFVGKYLKYKALVWGWGMGAPAGGDAAGLESDGGIYIDDEALDELMAAISRPLP